MNKAISNMIKTKEIAGKEVTIYLLPAGKGIVMAKELSKTILPVFTTVVGNTKEDGMDMGLVAEELVGNLDKLDILQLIKTLFNGMAIEGREEDFDSYFMGNYGMLIDILVFALEANFSSFFTGSDSLGQLFKE